MVVHNRSGAHVCSLQPAPATSHQQYFSLTITSCSAGSFSQPATVFSSHAKSAQPPASQPTSSVFLSRQISPATSHQPPE